MVKEVTMFYVECDNCGVSSCEGTDYSCWNDKQTALEMADDWIEQEGKHYCPNCFEIDDDDVITIKTKDNV